MTSCGQCFPRRDRVVIMARGLSVRMGVPKGLLRLAPTGPVFVRIIADLYLTVGLPVDVVTLAENAEAYSRELPEREDLRILPAGAGGDTALTLLIAWRSSLAAKIPCSHIWAHPVDLPLVTADSINLLRDHSHGNPDRIIRPEHRGVPGHPVILPRDVLALLDGQEGWQGGPLRNFLSNLGATGLLPKSVAVAIEDPGIVRDFDRPDDLNQDQSLTQRRGSP